MASDFNVAVDEIFRSQDLKRELAYAKAYAAGEKVGFEEGYPHGIVRGSQVGKQVGFYKGFALCHRAVLLSTVCARETPDVCKKRLLSLNRLLTLCDEFPRENTHDDLDAKLFELQSRFKQMCSVLSINPRDVMTASSSNEMF